MKRIELTYENISTPCTWTIVHEHNNLLYIQRGRTDTCGPIGMGIELLSDTMFRSTHTHNKGTYRYVPTPNR